MNEEYTFFWNGPFSQWYPTEFTVDGVTYTCAEQYMMHQKAITFGDLETSQKIMETSSPHSQKKLGRSVRNFDAIMWDGISYDIVKRGNVAKFEQNPILMTELMETYPTTLVEASPYDSIWGIGMGVNEAKKTPKSEWKGENRLGNVLTEVRNQLRDR
jgi:ribA/ribD-fused uncharacterized protein